MAHEASTPSPAPIDDALVAAIAAEADADDRTVVRRLAGLPVRGRPGRRVDAALAKRGLLREPGAASSMGQSTT